MVRSPILNLGKFAVIYLTLCTHALYTHSVPQLAGSPTPKAKDLQKQLMNALHTIETMKAKEEATEELTKFKIKAAVAEAEKKFFCVSSDAFQNGCTFAMNLAKQAGN